MKKIILILISYALSLLTGGAQTFTKEQMLEDFDFLYGKLDSVNTRFPIVKAVTGVDILFDLKEVRGSIDTVTCDAGFYDCLYRATLLCKDMHVGLAPGYPYKDYDESYINEAKKNTLSFSRSSTFSKYEFSYNPFQVYYVDGEYFTSNIYKNDFTYTLQIPERAKLLKINDLSVDEYVEKWMVPIARNPRWDNKNKKYYVKTLISPDRVGQDDKFKVTYSYNGKINEVDIESYRIKFANMYGGFTPKVLYFEKDKILYVRVPEMNHKLIEDYKAALLNYKDRIINKVVIDVRGNGGGSDQVWLDILTAIIGSPIPYPQALAFRDNPLVKKYMDMDKISYREEQLGSPLTIDDNTYFCIVDNGTITPSESSLQYTGNIYVLIDDGVFSSTLAFVAVCQNSDQLITVGDPSGYFGGQGVRPLYFIMPNTKFIFRVEYSLDCTGVDENNLEDYYRDTPEILVKSTLDDVFKVRNSPFELYDKDFLYTIDPVFKKVLGQP